MLKKIPWILKCFLFYKIFSSDFRPWLPGFLRWIRRFQPLRNFRSTTWTSFNHFWIIFEQFFGQILSFGTPSLIGAYGHPIYQKIMNLNDGFIQKHQTFLSKIKTYFTTPPGFCWMARNIFGNYYYLTPHLHV